MISIFLLLLALAFGSFATVLVFRIPAGRSIGGRSQCPTCARLISPRDNIPVVSYLLLKGRCRSCDQPIPVEYPLLEIAALGLCALVVLPQTTLMLKLATLVFIILGLALSVIDLQYKQLPNGLVLWLTCLLLLFLTIDAKQNFLRMGQAVAIGLGYSLFLFILRLASGGGMGLGDVKLALPLGLLTGYISFETALVSVATAFVSGAVVGLALMLKGNAGRKTQIPFGPFLVLGAIVGLIAS